jgi:hypothetical protein
MPQMDNTIGVNPSNTMTLMAKASKSMNNPFHLEGGNDPSISYCNNFSNLNSAIRNTLYGASMVQTNLEQTL